MLLLPPIAMLILGSASPRRRELLGLVCPALEFRIVAPDVDESVRAGEDALAYLVRIVRDKAMDVARRTRGTDASLLLCADTSVIVDGRVLGKPEDEEHGRAMLRELSGRTHEVWTAFVLADASGAVKHEEVVRTRVSFRALRAAEIDAYVAGGEGRDKAGGYAIQGGAAAFVHSIEGSPTNVVGLPLCEVTVALANSGGA